MRIVVEDWLAPSMIRWPDREMGPWQLELRWREEGGRATCTGASFDLLGGAPTEALTTAIWRAIPLGRLVAEARAARLAENLGGLIDEYDANGDLDVSPVVVEQFREAAEPWREQRSPGRPTVLDDQHYVAVAEAYSQAYVSGLPPRRAVSRRWTVSPPTASRWIAEARHRGLLPDTKRGRARGNADLAVWESDEQQEEKRCRAPSRNTVEPGEFDTMLD